MWCAQEIEPQITLANPIQGPCQTKWTQIAHFDIQNLMVVAPPLLQIYPNLTKPNLVEVCCGPPPSFKVTTFCTNHSPPPRKCAKIMIIKERGRGGWGKADWKLCEDVCKPLGLGSPLQKSAGEWLLKLLTRWPGDLKSPVGPLRSSHMNCTGNRKCTREMEF